MAKRIVNGNAPLTMAKQKERLESQQEQAWQNGEEGNIDSQEQELDEYASMQKQEYGLSFREAKVNEEVNTNHKIDTRDYTPSSEEDLLHAEPHKKERLHLQTLYNQRNTRNLVR